MKHKWYNEIVAWAGGAEIERNYLYREVAKWEAVPVSQPIDWGSSSYEYRIKPQPTQTKDEILRLCLKTFMELSERSSRHDDGLGYYDEECAAIREVLAIKEPKYLYVFHNLDKGTYEIGEKPHPQMNYRPIIGKIEVQDD